MTESAARKAIRESSTADPLEMARRILREESLAIQQIAGRLDASFVAAADRITACTGCVIVTGMGKAGLVGQKLSATLSSTGTPSHFLHPAEAMHGDLGAVRANDVILALSMSGRTEEVIRLAQCLKPLRVPLMAITSSRSSPLATLADIVMALGEVNEAGSLGLAPTTSTTAMMAVGDALALVVSHRRGFRADDFARFHPGGNLGRRLATVEEAMRPREQCRIADDQAGVREVLVRAARPGRRPGAVMLVDAGGRLTGIFTDSDLARLLEGKRDAALDRPMCEVMTRQPTAVRAGTSLAAAIEMLVQRKLSELPVLDQQGVPLGMIDITDLLDVRPETRPDLRIVSINDAENG